MKKQRLVHPGVLLKEEIEARSITCKHCKQTKLFTQKEFSAKSKLSERALSEIIHGKRNITRVTAIKIGNGFGTSWQMWLKLQQDYDLNR